MAEVNQNDTFYRNNARVIAYAITDKDAVGNPPLDLTSLTFKWALAPFDEIDKVFATTPVLEKKSTTPGEITVTDAPQGLVEVSLTPADTASFLGRFYHELEAFDGSGNGTVVATGFITFLQNVVNT